jgi:hypothetical protein
MSPLLTLSIRFYPLIRFRFVDESIAKTLHPLLSAYPLSIR